MASKNPELAMTEFCHDLDACQVDSHACNLAISAEVLDPTKGIPIMVRVFHEFVMKLKNIIDENSSFTSLSDLVQHMRSVCSGFIRKFLSI